VPLDRLLRATTKKVVNFFEEKSAVPDKILATPMNFLKLFGHLHVGLVIAKNGVCSKILQHHWAAHAIGRMRE